MRLLLVAIISFLTSSAFAVDQIHWNQGSLVIDDGQVLQGEVAFQVSELVLFRADGELRVFPAQKVQAFFYYDKEANINRKFVSMRSAWQPASFYEVVVWGEVSVIRQMKTNSMYAQSKKDKEDYNYFVRIGEEVVPLRAFRRKVYPMLISDQTLLAGLVKTQNLNPNDGADSIGIVKLYNRLTHPKTLTAGI